MAYLLACGDMRTWQEDVVLLGDGGNLPNAALHAVESQPRSAEAVLCALQLPEQAGDCLIGPFHHLVEHRRQRLMDRVLDPKHLPPCKQASSAPQELLPRQIDHCLAKAFLLLDVSCSYRGFRTVYFPLSVGSFLFNLDLPQLSGRSADRHGEVNDRDAWAVRPCCILRHLAQQKPLASHSC